MYRFGSVWLGVVGRGCVFMFGVHVGVVLPLGWDVRATCACFARWSGVFE